MRRVPMHWKSAARAAWTAAAALALAGAPQAAPAMAGDPDVHLLDPHAANVDWADEADGLDFDEGPTIIGGGAGLMVGRMYGEDGGAERYLDAADELELTDAQKTKLREIRRSAPSALMPKRQAVVEARMDFRDLLDAKDANPTELRKAHDRWLESRKDLDTALFDLRMQAREVLTPEQRTKLRDLRSDIAGDIRRQLRHEFRGHPRIKLRRFGLGDPDKDIIIEKF